MTTVPLVSIYTPSHQPKYLDQCLDSLLKQTYTHWEWVVLLNHDAQWSPKVTTTDHPPIKIIFDNQLDGIGAIKRRACAEAKGEILVELDHDDLLMPKTLDLIVQTFKDNPEVVFVYSDCAQIHSDGTPDQSHFNLSSGWQYKEEIIDHQTFLCAHSFEPMPHNLGYIWYAPNHVRSFRQTAYQQIGGYDSKKTILDDQDLMCRLYQIGSFKHIHECLYLQRIHENNTQKQININQQIQKETIVLYDQYFEKMALTWAKRNHLLAIDLGSLHHKPEGYLGVDQEAGAGVDIVTKLPNRLPLEDNSVGVIRAVDFLEHIADKIALINELYRVLAPNGYLISLTPSTDGRGAFQDPTHVAFYNENSFWYYTNQQYQKYVPSITVKFQSSRIVTYFPTEWHRKNQISYVAANLIAIKPEANVPRCGGQLLI